jgi:hypothetical protein
MKDIKIEERPEGFVYIEDTTFPAEPHGSYLKRNIQRVELIFTTKEDLEDFLATEREKKENAKASLAFNLTQTDEEIKKIDALAYSNNIKRLKKRK